MRLALCTISFRHQLISFAEIAAFAQQQGFDGIELWGTHAIGLMSEQKQQQTQELLHRLRASGITISMISDYLDISGNTDFVAEQARCRQLAALARACGTTRLRTFAGNRSSAAVSLQQYHKLLQRLTILCDICAEVGVKLVVETHPNTLLDSQEGILRLLSDLPHPSLRLNYDVLHIWEAHLDPAAFYAQVAERVDYFHLKNITARSRLVVFEPAAVYAANASREGMISLAHGAVPYHSMLSYIEESGCFASIEWFGADPFAMLAHEREWLRGQALSDSLVAGGRSLTNYLGGGGVD